MEIEKYIIASDQQLVEMVLEGDSAAFEQLFNRYRDAIHQLYIQRTGDRDDADDLLQETFVKVYLKLDRYNENYTFGQWLFTIARNTFIDYVRKRKDNLHINVSEVYGTVNPPSLTPNPEESVISSQQRSQLEEQLSTLDPKYRKLIELRFFKDYSYEEIAAELGLPMGTVKTQLHRAREKLCRFIRENSDLL